MLGHLSKESNFPELAYKTVVDEILSSNYNENSISEEILKKVFCNKINIIGKIENNKNFNLIINNNLNLEFLDKKTKNKFLKIIKNI